MDVLDNTTQMGKTSYKMANARSFVHYQNVIFVLIFVHRSKCSLTTHSTINKISLYNEKASVRKTCRWTKDLAYARRSSSDKVVANVRASSKAPSYENEPGTEVLNTTHKVSCHVKLPQDIQNAIILYESVQHDALSLKSRVGDSSRSFHVTLDFSPRS